MSRVHAVYDEGQCSMQSSRHSVTAGLVVVLVAKAGDVELKRCTVCMGAVGRQGYGSCVLL